MDGIGGKDWSNLDQLLKQSGGASPTDLRDLDDQDADSDDEPMPDLEGTPKPDDK